MVLEDEGPITSSLYLDFREAWFSPLTLMYFLVQKKHSSLGRSTELPASTFLLGREEHSGDSVTPSVLDAILSLSSLCFLDNDTKRR